ncbi:MAG: DUF1385 domain-containing protein [Firmicutes bacterium]|nr:DUF1385 domain-containing protein [Bacillota bacterium]
MSQKEKIGGRAYKNGVRLMNSRFSVKAYYDENGKLQVKLSSVKRSKHYKLIKKIPIIRGIVSLLMAIWIFLKEGINNPKKNWAILLILLLDLLYIFIPGSESQVTNNILNLIYFGFPALLLLLFRKTISEVLKYHGAEHKVVHYYENDCQGDIQSYSRLHKRCGSNIVFYYLLITCTVGLFVYIPLNPLLLELLFLGIAYELIRYTPEQLLFLPYLFQRLVTKEPEERHIRAAKAALELLR